MRIKPCPFCGGDAEVQEWPDLCCEDEKFFVYDITCLYCYGSTNLYSTKEEAIKAWNRRSKTDDKE